MIIESREMMGRFIIYLIIFFADLSFGVDENPSYRNYKLIHVESSGRKADNFILDLLESKVDFWSPKLLLVAPKEYRKVVELLKTNQIIYNVSTDDVQRLIDEERKTILRKGPSRKRKGRSKRQHTKDHKYCQDSTISDIIEALYFRGNYIPEDLNDSDADPLLDAPLYTYLDYCQVKTWLTEMAKLHSDIMILDSYGHSYEGRPLLVTKIGFKGKESDKKPVVWVDGGIHAREWIAVSSALFLIHKFLIQRDEATKELLDKFDWYIVPIVNPDGYEYSFYKNRLWRKTRCLTIKPKCFGVDANRNFNYHWGECKGLGPGQEKHLSKMSKNQCSETYAGKRPFSEPETLSFSRFFWSNRRRVKVYLSLHSFGNIWFLPYGFSDTKPHDYAQLYSVSVNATMEIFRHHGTEFVVGTPGEIMYFASGGSFDWVKGRAGVKYSFTLEVSDSPKGFILPPSDIMAIGGQVHTGVTALMRAIEETDADWLFTINSSNNTTNKKL